MAFDLIGIDNENEFYPAAFLSDALEDELRAALARWREGEATPANLPDTRLAAFGAVYLRGLERVRIASSLHDIRSIQQSLAGDLVRALGFVADQDALATNDGLLVPVLARSTDHNGRDQAWIVEAPCAGREDEGVDPLTLEFDPEQFAESDRANALLGTPIDAVLTESIFAMDRPPRYVIVVGLTQAVLVDRVKWPTRSVLRFDLPEIFTRAEQTTLEATACLLSKEARAPESGVPLAERLEEEAQRHANAVTTSLKKTVRDAIEFLGNEVLAVTGGKYPSGKRKGVWIDSQDLTIECLRYMYRLLFLFYAEANPRLGIIPLKHPVYLSGYSLEALRGLEMRKLRTEEDRKGTFLWESLQRLLGLMYEGLDRRQIGATKSFTLPRVRVSLLDPDSTPILSKISLRNEAVQKIIRHLSLKRDKAGSGRISYAQLGIGQLGAVYETLISFTGFVAKTDMIELIPPKGKKSATDEDVESAESEVDEEADLETEEVEQLDGNHAGSRPDKVDLLAPSYFVSRDRAEEFKREEIIYDGPQPRIYPKGRFIYRLAGRDRQKSASYYTPEPLARLLVKHTLLERCRDMSADEILELKILEPAMGSAAFLVETANQLADLYLERKQTEVGQRIPQDQYFEERQKVRAFIADRNCFGVDLNPIAVELAQISLWLNGLHSSDFSPWFGDQLHAGNSLIGARRAAYDARSLAARKSDDLWLNNIPIEIGWREAREPNHIWQFLLPAADMAKFDTDKSIAAFAGDAQKAIKAWRKAGFFAPFEAHEVKLLLDLSTAVDELFEAVAEDLKASRIAANDEITIWPKRVMQGARNTDFRAKLARLKVLQGEEHVSNSLPYQRLKTAMDAWCALWLWPLHEAHLLPSRNEYLLGLQSILKGGITDSGEIETHEDETFSDPQGDLITRQQRADQLAATLPSHVKQTSMFQPTNIDALVASSPWLKIAREVALRERFAHFDLIFADVLKSRRGFDLIVGNPPWVKPSWSESLVLADIDPIYLGKSVADVQAILPSALERTSGKRQFQSAYVSTRGLMEFTSSAATQPFAGGGANNLYACFLDLAFRLASPKNAIGLIHEDGHLLSTRYVNLRRAIYPRLRKHFHFRNELKTRMFAEIGNKREYSCNIYACAGEQIEFMYIYGMFLPSQVEDSLIHDGTGDIPTPKHIEGGWNLRGHSKRIIVVNFDYLNATRQFSGTEREYASAAPLLRFYAEPVRAAVVHLASVKEAFPLPGFHFSNMHPEDTRQELSIGPAFPADNDAVVLAAPQIGTANAVYQAANRRSRTHRDFDPVSLQDLPEDFLPRCKYAARACEPRSELYVHAHAYKLGIRRRVDPSGERMLVSAIIPSRWRHIETISSVRFDNSDDLLSVAAVSFAQVSDFVTRLMAQTTLRRAAFDALPYSSMGNAAKRRVLELSCITNAFASLWNEQIAKLSPVPWSSSDHRLGLETATTHVQDWTGSAFLRTDLGRRLALVELDVLVAMKLGLTVEQLIELYRMYAPVARQYEMSTWYDRNGCIVWTASRGLPRIGWLDGGGSPSRKAWGEMLHEYEGVEEADQILTCEVVDDTRPGGPRTLVRRFAGPFTRCDRVEDYRRAWHHFERLNSAGVIVI